MKHSKKLKSSGIATALMWLYPVLLVVPNLAMSALAGMQWSAALTNVVLPAGVYMLLMSGWRNVGRTSIFMFPIAVLAAFQVVLLGLYLDGSVIAVDMFLNVVTTNSSEATELLESLWGSMTLVLVLYLPPVVFGIVAWVKRLGVRRAMIMRARKLGAALSGLGLVFLILAHCLIPHYDVAYDVFPVNAVCNLVEAVNRTAKTEAYPHTSADFTYHAASASDPELKEVYIAVVGETSRANHYQLFGYPRFTTPLLCSVDSLISCGKVLSESNTTHKSVPMLLSTVKAENFGDSIYCVKSVISAFKEAGFGTAYVSAQAHNGSFIDYFGSEADTTVYLRDGTAFPNSIYDDELLPVVDSILAQNRSNKLLIVLHLYGSHFKYDDRYPRHEAFFIPDRAANATLEHRDRLINAYDNSIRMTDRVLHSLIIRLDSMQMPGGLIYTADHGEDIFDDERGRFLHASPTATFNQLHVPMILYFNEQYRSRWPEKCSAAKDASDSAISSSESYSHTLLHMAGVNTPRLHPHAALTSGEFTPVSERRFLNDRNSSVSLARGGFTSTDFSLLNSLSQK